MRRIYALLLAIGSVTATAQIEFPYNPDSNHDGWIGLSDLLEVLALYDDLFSVGNAYSDSSGAVLYLGNATYASCVRAVNDLGASWRIPSERDLCQHLVFMASVDSINYSPSTSWNRNFHGVDELTKRRSSISISYSLGSSFEEVPNLNGATFYASHSSTSLAYEAHCFAVTEVAPTIEYTVCSGDIDNGLLDCVNQKLAEGWRLLGGAAPFTYDDGFQAMWRYSSGQ